MLGNERKRPPARIWELLPKFGPQSSHRVLSWVCVAQESGEAWKEPGRNLLNLDSLAEDFKVCNSAVVPEARQPLSRALRIARDFCLPHCLLGASASPLICSAWFHTYIQ